jgi:hypothetical protein
MSQPLWILKTAKEKQVQRFVNMSVDLARQVGLMLEDVHNGLSGKVISYDIPFQISNSFLPPIASHAYKAFH